MRCRVCDADASQPQFLLCFKQTLYQVKHMVLSIYNHTKYVSIYLSSYQSKFESAVSIDLHCTVQKA